MADTLGDEIASAPNVGTANDLESLARSRSRRRFTAAANDEASSPAPFPPEAAGAAVAAAEGELGRELPVRTPPPPPPPLLAVRNPPPPRPMLKCDRGMDGGDDTLEPSLLSSFDIKG